MAKRDQLAGSLGRQDAGQAGHLQHIAFRQATIPDERHRGRGQANGTAGAGLAKRLGLRAGIDHAAGALVIEMRKFRHGLRSAAKLRWALLSYTSSWDKLSRAAPESIPG